MKTLHVTDTLNIGGAEKICLEIISMLLDAGHQADCLIISAKGPLFERIDIRSKSFFLNRKNKYSISSMRKCAEIVSGYDIVHVHMRHTWAYIKLSCMLFRSSAKLIFHDHYGNIAIDRNPTFRLKGPFKPEFYIGVSREITEWAVAKLNINENSIFLLENTVVPHYDSSDKYGGDWVMVSNLRSTKNILFAIRMAEKMKRRLVVFGNHDGSSYADKVIEFSEKSEFIRIVQNETDVQQYLGNFKLGIHTSLSETGPLVLLEFLAHGLPFITFNTGEVVNQIRKELPSYIAMTLSEKEWEGKINSLEMESMYNREMLKQKLQQIFITKFSPQAYINKCLKIYQSALTCS